MVLVWLHLNYLELASIARTKKILAWFAGGLALAITSEGLQLFFRTDHLTRWT
jgi:hypothetical protein